MPLKMEPKNMIFINLGINANGPVHSFFTNTCYKHMDKFVPKDNGDLRGEVTLTTNTITYEMPYAHYQWLGMREDGTHKIKSKESYTTPGTGPHWDERMISAEKEKVIKEVQNYASRFSK